MKKKLMALICCLVITTSCAAYAEETTTDQTETTDENNATLSDEDYKAQCQEIWYDDIIFGDRKDLTDTYVKLDLFVEEIRIFDAFGLDYTTEQLFKDYDLDRTFFRCGVKRDAETWSYVGQTIDMLISNSVYGETDVSNIHAGDHLTVYCKVISCLYDAWNGYNSVYVLPRIIENRGQ